MLLIVSMKIWCNERNYLKIINVNKSNACTFEYTNQRFGNKVLNFHKCHVYAVGRGRNEKIINATLNHI